MASSPQPSPPGEERESRGQLDHRFNAREFMWENSLAGSSPLSFDATLL